MAAAAATGKEEGLCGLWGHCKSLCRRCKLLVREQRSRFYILRRCVVMLVCWREGGDS